MRHREKRQQRYMSKKQVEQGLKKIKKSLAFKAGYALGKNASRAEQHERYLDCGPQAWDDRD